MSAELLPIGCRLLSISSSLVLTLLLILDISDEFVVMAESFVLMASAFVFICASNLLSASFNDVAAVR